MFIKFNVIHRGILIGEDPVKEYMASTPSDAFCLATMINKAEDVIAWNMGVDKPRHFGWAGFNKYIEKFTEDHYN